ncbi:MAG: type II toxin-antitoxin system HicB family antitoxin [Chitinophagaceae bacterium]
MKKYLVVIEKARNNYSAFTPDIPGCITVGNTVEKTIEYMKEAIELAIEAGMDHSMNIPEPKGLLHHIKAGIFDKNEIADEYYIAQVEVPIPQPHHFT